MGFSGVSSRKWDQADSRAARRATASLGGQEISSDPPFYDPQLSASETAWRPEGIGQEREEGKVTKKKKCNLIGRDLRQQHRWEKL